MKYIVYMIFFLVTLTLSMFLWSKNDWKESSLTKYEFFISSLKQSEMDRVRKILDLNISEGEITMSNEKAKMMFYKTLALPLQSVCQVLKRVGGHWMNRSRKQVDGDKFVCLDQ